jgi:AcrR family transcriptional regulator
VRKSARPFYSVPDLGAGKRGRVFKRLLAEAVALVRRGRIPSVAEVAQSAGVSRATAYRYFPSRSKLVSAVIAEALAPVQRAVPQAGDPKERLHQLLDRTYSRFAEYEPHMRAALQLARWTTRSRLLTRQRRHPTRGRPFSSRRGCFVPSSSLPMRPYRSMQKATWLRSTVRFATVWQTRATPQKYRSCYRRQEYDCC